MSMSVLQKPKNDAITNEKNVLEAPFITYIPDATNSAAITIEGTSSYSDAQVELFVDGDLYDTAPLSDDQKFSFDGIRLNEGTNIIKARVKKGSNTGEFTRSYDVVYNKEEAKLEITSPTDGATFTRGDQTIAVQGKTEPDSIITVNGSRAIVDEAGSFTYYHTLTDGENTISVDAESAAGKRINKTLKVTYKP